MKKNIISEEFSKKIKTPLLYRITQTIILTLVIFCVFLLILYIVGNFQNFQDESQKIILKVLLFSAILTSFLTVPIFIENIIMLFTIKKKKMRIISLLLMILTVIFCAFCIIFCGAIELISEGF